MVREKCNAEVEIEDEIETDEGAIEREVEGIQVGLTRLRLKTVRERFKLRLMRSRLS